MGYMADTQDARSRLLQEAAVLLSADGGEILQRGLTLSRLAKASALSRKTVHSYFSSEERSSGPADLHYQLVRFLAAQQPARPLDIDEDDPPADAAQVRQSAERGLGTVADDPYGQSRAAMVSLAIEPTELRYWYGAREQDLATALRACTRDWGCAAAGSFDEDALAVVIAALCDGLTLRAAVEPDHTGDWTRPDLPALYAVAVLHLLTSVLHPRSERRRDIDGTFNAVVDPPYDPADDTEDLRSEVLEKALREFTMRGVHETTLSHIAQAVQTPKHLLHSYFGGWPGIVVAVFDELASCLRDDLRRNLEEYVENRRRDSDPAELRRVGLEQTLPEALWMIALFVEQYPDLSHATYGLVYGGGGGLHPADLQKLRRSGPMTKHLTGLVGLLRTDRVIEPSPRVSDDQIARALITSLMVQMFADAPSAAELATEPATAVAVVTDTVVNGIA